MAMTIQCPSCNQMISVDVPPGTQVQCPLCNQVVTVPAAGMAPSAEGPPTMPYSPYQGQKLDQGTAIGALVCGILGLTVCGPVGIAGIVMGSSALKKIKSDPARYGGRGLALGGIWTGVASLVLMVLMIPLMIAILLPAFSQAGDMAKRTACMGKLRIVGSALQIYASEDENGAFPDDITKLVGREIRAQELVCPSAGTGQTYYYVPGYTNESDPEQIIMYDDPNNHLGQGGNILYVDGSVLFVNSPEFERQIDAITLPDGTPFTPHQD